jgi:uncharacterized protein involved in cysteine biosynthesis
MDKPEVRFGEWIQDGFSLYKNNFGVLVVASIIALVLSLVTVGILAGPMAAGLSLITLRLIDRTKPTPAAGDIFQGFRYFLQSFLFVLAWGIIVVVGSAILSLIPCIGSLVTFALSLVIQALLMFSFFLIVDAGMDFWPASMASIRMVRRNFWPFLGFSIVASLIGGVGAILLGVGVVLTLPIEACIYAVAYREVFRERLGFFSFESTSSDKSVQPEGPRGEAS